MPSRHDPPVEDLDAIIDELYAADPAEFIRLRDTQIKSAKERGEVESARQLSALRKPSIGAWLANQLVRAVPDDLEALLAVGAGLREAQSGLRGDELRALSQQRRQAVNALVRRARQVAVDLGRPVSEQVAREVEQTLEAALSDPLAAEQVQVGRLTTPLEPTADFGSARPQLHVVRDQPASTPPAGRRGKSSLDAATKARAAQTGTELRETELRETDLREARAAAAAAERDVATHTTEQAALESKADELETRAVQVRRQIDELTRELTTINDALTAVQSERRDARRRALDAERSARAARRRVEIAEAAVTESAANDERTRT